jgi:hypothetical protein
MQRLFREKLSPIWKGLSWKRLFSLVLAIGVFSFLGIRAIRGFQEISQTSIDFSPGYLVFSFLSQFFGVLLAAAVWSNILSRINVKTSFSFDLEVFSVSALARKIPGTVWYAIGRLAIYSFEGIKKAPVIIGLAIEAIALALGGAIALSLSLGLGLISFEWLNKKIFWVATPGLIAIFSILGPKLIEFAVRRTQKRDPSVKTNVLPQIKTSDVLVWLAGEAGVAAFAGGVAYFVLRSIIPDSSVPYAAVMGAFSMSMVIGPIAMWLPGDIGIKDGFMYLVLIAWMSSSQAAVIVLAWRIWLSLIEILIGLVAGISLSRRINIKEALFNDRNKAH